MQRPLPAETALHEVVMTPPALPSPLRTILWIAVATAPRSSAATAPEEILATWRRHQADYPAVQIETTVIRTEAILTDGSNDPFAAQEVNRGKTREPVNLKGLLTFSIDHDKISLRRVAEIWDDRAKEARIQQQSAVFDGETNRKLNSQDGFPPTASLHQTVVPDDILVRYVETEALWLAVAPVTYFDRRYGFPDKMQIEAKDVLIGDVKCTELSIPTLQVGVEQRVLVDSNCRPVRWFYRYKGVLRHEINLRLQSRETADWRLSDWSTRIYGNATEEIVQLKGTVKAFKVNEALDNSAFDLKLPAGITFNEEHQPVGIKRNAG
jgi:hypothetical protein